MIKVRNGSFPAPSDPLLIKALSCREALSWLKDMKLSNVTVESDSLMLINTIRENFSASSYFGMIVQDCKVLAKDLGNCSFSFIRRSANQVVHAFARAAGSVSDLGLFPLP